MTTAKVKPFKQQPKVLCAIFSFTISILLAGVLLRSLHSVTETPRIFQHNESMTNAASTTTVPPGKINKGYLYNLLTNTSRSLIQMEIKARRLQENMRRIKERTADLLWKQDKALWHILFKNMSRHISLRHEFHQHASLKRIMQDSEVHKHNTRLERKRSRKKRKVDNSYRKLYSKEKD